MKSKSLILTAVIATSLTLGGCEQVKTLLGGNKPSGQVIATVKGDEITAMELRQEMGNFSSRDPKVMKDAQQRALQSIIMRKLLVQQAREQKLDKSADFVNQVRRGEEGLLVQAYQRKIAASVAAPSRSDAEAYIAANPAKFAQRRVMIVDQIVSGGNSIPPAEFRALNTLEQVRGVLDAKQVPYQTNTATLDTLALDPRLLAQLDKLPPGEVFVMPQGGGLVFNRIMDTRVAPFQGDPAIAYATQALRSQRSQEAVVRQVAVLRKGAEKDVTYSEAFKPSPEIAKMLAGGTTPAPAAAAAPAAAPAPAAPAAAPAKP